MKANIEINDEEVVVYTNNATVTVSLCNQEDYLVEVVRAPYGEHATETIPKRLSKRFKQKGKH